MRPRGPFRVDVGLHPACGQSLRAVGGHGIAVIELAHLRWVEADRTLVLTVELYCNALALDLLGPSRAAGLLPPTSYRGR